MINILLADDHKIVIEGLKAVLDGQNEIKICGEASNGKEVLELLKNDNSIDVAILDINMPEMDGLTCARHIKINFPKVKVIILTMYSQKSFIDEIIKIGVDGCLLKNNTGKELKEAIDRVMEGRSYYDLINDFISEDNEIAQFKLGEREIEIIKLLSKGFTSNEIAEKLFISEHTVKTHRKNILRKTDLKNTSQLMQFAINNKIL